MEIDTVIRKYLPMTPTTFLILFSLRTPKHGYAILENVKTLTQERKVLVSGTLYGTLGRMEKEEII